MKQALSYIVGAVIAAGVVEILGSYNRKAAISLAFITVLLVIIANQEKVQQIVATMGVKTNG